jgi:hypothetical protein
MYLESRRKRRRCKCAGARFSIGACDTNKYFARAPGAAPVTCEFTESHCGIVNNEYRDATIAETSTFGLRHYKRGGSCCNCSCQVVVRVVVLSDQ